MLAVWAPSSRAASRISHWAAAIVASSVANAAVQARSRMTSSRNAVSSSTTPVAVEMRGASETGSQVREAFGDMRHRLWLLANERIWISAHGSRVAPSPPSE